MFKLLHDLLEFLKGIPDVLRSLLGLLNEAPEPYREWLVAAFWIVVAFLPMTWLALKILSSQPYRNAYQLIGKVGRSLFRGVNTEAALPPPSPWVLRVFKPLIMVAGYFGALLYLLFGLAIFTLLALSDQIGVAALLGGVGMLIASGYFVWLSFSMGERARLDIFKQATT